MTIMWSNRQTAECTWFVSLNGYDTVSAWNAYLLSQSLPQDCTAANIGSSTYPFRTWAQVVADSRSVTGQKVAVGLGKWGVDMMRSVWAKSMQWMGMTGTVIDMSLLTGVPFRYLILSETIDGIDIINGESVAFASIVGTNTSLTLRSCRISCIKEGISDIVTLYMYNCIVLNSQGLFYTMLVAYNCTFTYVYTANLAGTFSKYMSCIMQKKENSANYCCVFGTGQSPGDMSYHNIASDPLFNNSAIGDYTLRSDSPCLYKGKNATHIGALGEARAINPNSPEMADGTAVYSLTGGLTDLVKTSYDVSGVTVYMLSLRTGKMSGTVESGWIDLGRTRKVDSLRFVADMIYSAGGNYAQAPSPDLNKLSVSYKAALTEAEKAGVAWVSTEWGAEDLAVSARYIKLLITVTSTTPAP